MNNRDRASSNPPIAVLVSGGVDSAILLADLLETHSEVHPLFVRCGLNWEEAELAHFRQFLAAIASPRLRPLTVLEMPTGELYGNHWSISGEDVPDEDTPDEDVFLPGRNILLASKALLWCHLHDIGLLACGQLARNPFSDATPEFFRAFAESVSLGVGRSVHIVQPYREMTKAEVLRVGASLPLEWTFSCIAPVNGRHCGSCNKCAERKRGFEDAGLEDPTNYQEQECSV